MFQDLSTGKRIGSGHKRGGIYNLDDRVTRTGLVADQPDPVLLWHWHLGYPSVQKLQSVIPIESSVSSLGCKSCKLGKHHHTTFQSRVNNRRNSAFEFVHSDFRDLVVCPLLKVLDIFFSLLMTSLA